MMERLMAALVDPARRERAVLGVLLAYVAVWTVYAVLSKASQDMNDDTSEAVAWAREPALGYAKHPPLAAFVAGLWTAVFPLEDWAFHLLCAANAAVALWIAWRISASYLDGEKRVLGLALLTLVPFLNVHALKFNVSTVLLPLWAMTTLFFLRSFETRGFFDSVLAGVGAAASMLGKYWSVLLLAGLGIAALLDPRRAAYFRSAAPWITTLVAAAIFAPHFVWLVQHDFSPLFWAHAAHRADFGAALVGALFYCGALACYVALPVALMAAIVKPSWAAVKDSLWPSCRKRRFVAIAFWVPLLLPAIMAPFARVELVSLWAIPSLTLFPIMLLSSPLIVVARDAAVRILAVAVSIPLLLLLLAPAIAFAIHVTGDRQDKAHYRLLADAVTRLWHQTTDRPLRLVDGMAFGVAFYSPDRPSIFRDLDPVLRPAASAARLDRDGIALVCDTSDRPCIDHIEAFAAGRPVGRRVEVTFAREFFGWKGGPSTYLIIIVPPR